MREVAETKNIQADTAKKTGELASIDIDNMVKAATTGAKIENENLTVNLSRSYLALSVLSIGEGLLDRLPLGLQHGRIHPALCRGVLFPVQVRFGCIFRSGSLF